jgi:hypothetical protein
VIASVRDREIVIGAEIPPDGWPVFPSFPIFWSNVIEFLASGTTREWVIRKTREAVMLRDGRTVQPTRVGANRFGGETVHANLLDRRASDLSGESRPFDASRLPEAPVERGRKDLSAWPSALSLLFVLLAWWCDMKSPLPRDKSQHGRNLLSKNSHFRAGI